MLAIFPLQDWISIDEKVRNRYVDSERINDPSNPNHYWRYRMHIPLEELLQANKMNRTIATMLEECSRKR